MDVKQRARRHRSWRCVLLMTLGGSVCTLSAVSATDNWLHDSLAWEARSRVIKSALVLEAEVLRTDLTTVDTSTGCQWIAEVWLRPLEVIWGECADDSIRAFSAALPTRYSGLGIMPAFADSVRERNCVFYQLDEQAPTLPSVGTIGLFQLQEKGPIRDHLNLGVLRHAFQPLRADSMVSIPAGLGQEDHIWSYEVFRTALEDAARSRTLAGMLAGGELVALVKLAAWKDRERSRNLRTGRRTVRLPVEIEQVYQGEAPPDSCGLVLLIKPAKHRTRMDPHGEHRRSTEARRLAVDIPAFPSHRAVVVGHADTTDIFLVDCIPIDTNRMLRVRRPSVTDGELRLFRHYDPSVIEDLLPAGEKNSAVDEKASTGDEKASTVDEDDS